MTLESPVQGKPARRIWRGAFETGQQCTSSGTYPADITTMNCILTIRSQQIAFDEITTACSEQSVPSTGRPTHPLTIGVFRCDGVVTVLLPFVSAW
jgi:hypothetical protein